MALDQVSDSDSFVSETDYDNPLQKFKQTDKSIMPTEEQQQQTTSNTQQQQTSSNQQQQKFFK
uniref:Uncharacterized protein n=1 Tax=Meloidogyne incognita TaxID=6306 RepID=A0A914MER3_MELIC